MTMNLPTIESRYLQRDAYVYLRQSSPGQVRRNVEGQRRQRAMVERVENLGWQRSQIVLLDADSGTSGSTQHGREDLLTLFEAIATGRAGIVAARELSRLVRDNQDWGHIVRLCRFQDVLMADERRLYDPRDAQDRMVLGIQGAFNEFELAMILDRMHECLREKAQRGEQYDAFSPGYVCRQGSLMEKHPDPRVQRAVEKIFQDFPRFPSVRQLYLHLLREKFQLFVVPHGRDWRDVLAITPSYGQILEMLRNPVYAGIYVRGRQKAFAVLDENGHKQTKTRRVPREQWDVFLENHHEAYISQETWERNVEKIDANANTRGKNTKGAPGNGESLMAGLLRCRRCGQRLGTHYSSRGVRYVCRGGRKQREQGGAMCFSFAGGALEVQLADELLDVVSPAGIAAAERAAVRLSEQHAARRQLLVDRLTAACEAEERASREYKQTDVTYTAVRRTLAMEWEVALARVAEEESRLTSFDENQPVLPTPAQRKQLTHLGEDVRRLWKHPQTTMSLKQQLVRVLIEEIVADVDEQRDEIVLLIHWSGGHHTELRASRKACRRGLPRGELQLVVTTLRKVLPDKPLASVLNRAKVRSSSGKTWTASRVKRYREREGIAAFSEQEKMRSGWLTQSETATRLGISPMSVHRLVRAGILPAEQPHPGFPMVICETSLNQELVQQVVKSLKSGHIRPLPEDPRQKKLF